MSRARSMTLLGFTVEQLADGAQMSVERAQRVLDREVERGNLAEIRTAGRRVYTPGVDWTPPGGST